VQTQDTLLTFSHYSVIRVFLGIRRRKHYTVFEICSYTFYSLIRIFPRSLWKTYKQDFTVGNI